MTEPAPRPEPIPANPEILKLEKIGLYQRILVASQPGADITAILNPDPNMPINNIVPPDVSSDRNYNQVTKDISRIEREEAWQHQPNRTLALDEWKDKLTANINATTDEKKIHALQVISGKSPVDFTKVDAQRLYDDFCKESDTKKFVATVIQNMPKVAGKIRAEHLKSVLPDLEWFASKFFGENTSKVVARMIEIEARISNDGQEAITTIFSDPTRINNLEEEEKAILNPIFQKLQTPRSTTPGTSGATPAPDNTPTAPPPAEPDTIPARTSTPEPATGAATDEERLNQIQDTLNTIQRGEPIFHPITHRQLIGSAKEDFIGDLKKELTEVQSRINTASSSTPAIPPAGPTAPPSVILRRTPVTPSRTVTEPQGSPMDLSDLGRQSGTEAQTHLLPTIAIEGDPRDFSNSLNEALSEIKDNSPHLIDVSVDTIRGYLINSAATSEDTKLVNEGSYYVDELNNQIEISGLIVNGKGKVGVGRLSKEVSMDTTLNLLIGNSEEIDGDISARLINCSNLLAQGKVKDSLRELNDNFRKNIKKAVEAKNKGWEAKRIRIVGKRVLIEFYNENPLPNLPT